MLDIAAMSSVLKVRYLGQLRKSLNNSSILWSKLEKKVQKVTGKNFTIALHVGRTNSAALGLAEYEALPAADRQEYAECTVPNKFIYSTLEVSGPAIAAGRDTVGSFVDTLESEVDGLQRDTKRAMNRIVHGGGYGDALAHVQANISGTSSGFVDDNQGNAFVHLPSGKRFKVDILDIDDLSVDATGVFAQLGAKTDSTKYAISFYDAITAGSLTNVTVNDGDVIVPAGNVSAAVQKTPIGIGAIISNLDPTVGALQGIAVAGKEWWQAQVFSNGGTLRQLDLGDMQEVIDQIATNTDYTESDLSMLMCNYPVRRAYFKMMLAERRQVNTMKLDGGWSALDFNGMPFVVDSQCKRNVIYYIVLDTLGVIRTSDFDWMDKDGSYLYRTNGKDAYSATLYHYGNLVCYNRNGNGLLSDILEA